MKILLVNKFYYRRGGDCVHFLALEKLLRNAGHEVAVLTMRSGSNMPLRSDDYEVGEVSMTGTVTSTLKAACRILGWGIDKVVRRALNEFRPDVVHLHNIHSYISPRVAQLAREAGCRVVWTLHDYKLLCGAYSFLCGGKICTDCIANSPFAMVRRRCMKNSLSASVLAYAEAKVWSRRRISSWVDAFICPSEFMREKMIEGRFESHRLHVLNNFVDTEVFNAGSEKRDGVCYIGRLSAEKGVDILAKVAAEAAFPLTIAGTGPLEKDLKSSYGSCENIRFAGQLGEHEVAGVLRKCKVSVMPSVCYDNNPLSVGESFCCGTPVVASRLGGLTELVSPENGLLFSAGNEESMRRAILQSLKLPWDNASISSEARQRFSPEAYCRSILRLYGSQAGCNTATPLNRK